MEIYYVLGNMSVECNENANGTAKMVAEARDIRACPEKFTFLTLIGRTVMEKRWKKAKHWFRARHEGPSLIQPVNYNPAPQTHRPNEAAMRRQAHISHWYYQSRSGYVVTSRFLKRLRKRESDHCWECNSRSRMDIHHIMFRCIMW